MQRPTCCPAFAITWPSSSSPATTSSKRGYALGGERGRVALALFALTGANLLLLDEPTNHLDLPSQEILEAILNNSPGTILLVSHDRYLIDALATQVWEVMPDDGTLKVFDGNYSQYKAFTNTRRSGQPWLH